MALGARGGIYYMKTKLLAPRIDVSGVPVPNSGEEQLKNEKTKLEAFPWGCPRKVPVWGPKYFAFLFNLDEKI